MGLTLSPDFKSARVFTPFDRPSRYKGAYGGRGSGKSHEFAQRMVEEALTHPGFRGVCIREVQKTLNESAKKLIEDKILEHGLEPVFDIQRDRILTPGGGSILFQGMTEHNKESIKSLEGINVAWVEEAQTLSAGSLQMLRPTIRGDDSEMWFSWNPTRKSDPIDQFLRGENVPEDAIVLRANWSDNPWFPSVLEDERCHDLDHFPERYPHIWEGEYATIVEGAYFMRELTQARKQGRIDRVTIDPLLPVHIYHDLAFSSSDKADAYSMWVVQFVGQQIRVLAYYETVGQALTYHVRWVQDWMEANDPGRVIHVLPHDGSRPDGLGKRYEDHWREAATDDYKWQVRTIPNQGQGAAMRRVEAVRRLFPQMWFNERECEAGLEALAFYHEKQDEKRLIGLGPNHDWSSHAADAFGLMALDHSLKKGEKPKPRDYAMKPKRNHKKASWAW